MVVVVIAGILVCSIGLQNGLEKVTKVMMISLLLIMIVLAVNSFFMDGAKEGLSFYLIPDFGRMKEIGIIKTDYRCHEPGILYIKSWYRRHGNLRKLYRKGTLFTWRVVKHRLS